MKAGCIWLKATNRYILKPQNCGTATKVSCIAQKLAINCSYRMSQIDCQSIYGSGRKALAARHAKVVSSTLLLWWILPEISRSRVFFAFSGRLASSPRRRSPAKRRRPHTLTTLRAACELRAIFLVACVSLLRPDSLHIHRIIDGCST